MMLLRLGGSAQFWDLGGNRDMVGYLRSHGEHQRDTCGGTNSTE